MAKVNVDFTRGMSGTSGNAVFVQTKYGTVIRARVTPRNPRTASQTAARGRVQKAAALYRALTPAQALAWKDYAAQVERDAAANGAGRPLNAYNVFVALTTKWLQLHPGASPPATPPAAPFTGDAISVTASGASGKIVFTANVGNGPNVVTELLTQKLTSAARTPAPDKYRTQVFIGFASGNLVANVALPAGVYAVAIRFVQLQTGQSSPIYAGNIVAVS